MLMRIFLLIESMWQKRCYPWVASICRGTVPGPPVDVKPWGYRPTLPANGAFSHIPSKSAFSDIMLVAGNRLPWEYLHHGILQMPQTSTAVYRRTSAAQRCRASLVCPFPSFLLGSSSCCSDQTLQGRPVMGWTTLRVTRGSSVASSCPHP